MEERASERDDDEELERVRVASDDESAPEQRIGRTEEPIFRDTESSIFSVSPQPPPASYKLELYDLREWVCSQPAPQKPSDGLEG